MVWDGAEADPVSVVSYGLNADGLMAFRLKGPPFAPRIRTIPLPSVTPETPVDHEEALFPGDKRIPLSGGRMIRPQRLIHPRAWSPPSPPYRPQGSVQSKWFFFTPLRVVL